MNYDHKKKKFANACGLTNERFAAITEKVSLIGFLSQQKSEALEIIAKDETITQEEKPVAYYLIGTLLENVRLENVR